MHSVPARLASALAVFALAAVPAARAENRLNYQLLDDQQAVQLTRGGGSIGMDVGRGQVIRDTDVTFELLRVQSVRPGTPAAKAGLSAGDQVIAVEGRVFASVAGFASFIGSLPPGRTVAVGLFAPWWRAGAGAAGRRDPGARSERAAAVRHHPAVSDDRNRSPRPDHGPEARDWSRRDRVVRLL